MAPPEPRPRRDLFGGLFDPIRETVAAPGVGVANTCRRSTAEALKVSSDGTARELGHILERATMGLTPLAGEGRGVVASIIVEPARLGFARDHTDEVASELRQVVAHHGWDLRDIRFIAAAEAPVRPPTGPPKRLDVVAEIANTIAQLKSYDVEAFCDRVGAPPSPYPDADPHNSKAGYTRARLDQLDLPDLLAIAGAVLEELDSPQLEELVDRCRASGVGGAVKNLIFASTKKPDLVLTDAITNEIALVNPDAALIYDGGIPDEGLRWRVLLRSLLPDESVTDERGAARRLFNRLAASLGSEAEQHLFRVFATRYRNYGFDEPALLPQVWFHYDPRSAHARGGNPPLFRQRLDFLLLLPNRRRVVIEVDGVEHYSQNGKPSPSRYAAMVRADRELRLAGYEMYRFGGAELPDGPRAEAVLTPFFDQLLGGG
jgi:hypothetical protein